MTNEPSVKVAFAPTFQKAIKQLQKRYPHIQDDVQPVIERLIAGETPGDPIQSAGYRIYKVRLPNRDAQWGKSGGYRVIYYLQAANQVTLLLIYAKSDRSDIDLGEIRAIIADLPETEDK